VGVVYVTCQRVLWVREGVAGTGLDAGDTASVPLAAVVQIDPHKWSLFASKTPRVRLLVNLDDAATPTTSPLHAVRSAAVTFAFRRVPAKVTPLLTSASSREILTSPRPLAPTTHNECPLLFATGSQRRRCGRHAVRGVARSAATTHPPRASPACHRRGRGHGSELPAACCRLGLRPLHSRQRIGRSGTSCPLIRSRTAPCSRA